MSSETLTDFQIYHTPSKIPGKKGIPLAFISETLDFSKFNPYILDLSSLSQQGIELEVQTIEIDNTNNPNQVDLVYSREIQLVRQFPASIIQAYTVPGVINPKQITVTNAQNSGTIRIYLYGYPLPDSASINISGSDGSFPSALDILGRLETVCPVFVAIVCNVPDEPEILIDAESGRGYPYRYIRMVPVFCAFVTVICFGLMTPGTVYAWIIDAGN